MQLRSYKCGADVVFELCDTYRSNNCTRSFGQVSMPNFDWEKAISVKMEKWIYKDGLPLIQTFKRAGCNSPGQTIFASYYDLRWVAGLEPKDIRSLQVEPGWKVYLTEEPINYNASSYKDAWLYDGQYHEMVYKSALTSMSHFEFVGGDNWQCINIPYNFNALGLAFCKTDCPEQTDQLLCCKSY